MANPVDHIRLSHGILYHTTNGTNRKITADIKITLFEQKHNKCNNGSIHMTEVTYVNTMEAPTVKPVYNGHLWEIAE